MSHQVLATLCSIGGFIGGGGAVYIYAKATDQTIEWRGIPGISWCLKHFRRQKRD